MPQLSQTAIIGLAVGFSSIVGFIILCCLLWYCCCSDDQKENKKKPCGPWMEMGKNVPHDFNSNTTNSTVVAGKDISGKNSRMNGRQSGVDSNFRETNSRYSSHSNRSYQKFQKPLKAPYKNPVHDDIYYSQSPGVGRRVYDSSGVSSQSTSRHSDSPLVNEPHHSGNSTSRHQNKPSVSTPDAWYNVNTSTAKDFKDIKNNPQLLYQRYLY